MQRAKLERKLTDLILRQIALDIENADLTALELLVSKVDIVDAVAYLNEKDQSQFKTLLADKARVSK